MGKKLVFLAIAAVIIPLILTFLRKPSAQNTNTITGTPPPSSLTKFPTITLPPAGTYVQNQLVVKYKSGMAPDELTDRTKLQEIDTADKAINTLKKEKLYTDTSEPLSLFYVITLNQGADLAKAISIYQSLPEADKVQTNGIVKTNR